jgi:tetratricopeptide (TPR) repeat protein
VISKSGRVIHATEISTALMVCLIGFFMCSEATIQAQAASDSVKSRGEAHQESAIESAALLRQARRLIHQGLLSEAMEYLSRISERSPVRDRGSCKLLLGNVAYERGAYDDAEAKYAEAEQLLIVAQDPDNQVSEALQAVRSNRAMAHEEIGRLAVIRTKATWLQVATITALFSIGVLLLLTAARTL